MGRIYSIQFTEVAVSAQQDLFQIGALVVPSILHSCVISQSSDVGDASAAMVSMQVRRFTDTVTNVTVEQALDPGDPAAQASLNVNQTTELVAGTAVIHSEVWNVAMPWIYLPPPELRPIIKIGNGMAINMNTTDALTISGTLYFEEIGS